MTDARDSRVLRFLPAPSKIGHVPAIDGLRAIAVLAVIAFHAEPTWLPGGLTGVDIFFAISGFVVPASILWREFDRPVDALSFFYARRLLRIFPALILMLVIASFAVFLFVPRSWLGDGIVQTAQSAFLGTSNIVLYSLEGDYFSPQAMFNPFLHTWSLGVEEQFYVVFSLFFFVLCLTKSGWARALVYASLPLLTVLSVVVAATMSPAEPAYAFYILPARFWELGVGVSAYLGLPVLVPWLQRLRPLHHALLVLACGIGLLVPLTIGTASSFAYPFPVVLPCVVSTSLLMASSVARADSYVSNVLAWRPLRYVGLISYSLYLWHWPVFVLMRWTSGFSTPLQVGTGIAVSFLLAVLSYHVVEKPLRSFASSPRRPRKILIGGALGAGALALGLVFAASKVQDSLALSVTSDTAVWFPYKLDAKLAKTCKVDSKQKALPYGREWILTPECQGKKNDPENKGSSLFVSGDSHAMALMRMLQGFAATTGMRVRVLARPGCTIVFGRDLPQDDCRRFAEEVLRILGKEANDRDVVFFPGLRTPRQIEVDGIAEPPASPLSDRQSAAVLADSLARLADLSARRVPVILEAPQPVFRSIAFRCSDWFNRNNPDCGHGNASSEQAFQAMRRPLLDAMRSAAATQADLSIWDPSGLVCDGSTCRSWIDGKPMFFDGDHASGYANDRMLPSFRAAVLGRLSAEPANAPQAGAETGGKTRR